MRKRAACNGSSDDSSSGSIDFYSQTTVHFLKNMDDKKEISERDFDSSNYSKKSALSFESSLHDIYENTDLIVER